MIVDELQEVPTASSNKRQMREEPKAKTALNRPQYNLVIFAQMVKLVDDVQDAQVSR